jgi:hypothetical protein
LDDYVKTNAKTWLLQRYFILPNPYILVTLDEIKTMYPPDSKVGGRWIEFSAVGFNADRTVAIVYMASRSWGDGKSFVLEKHHSKWKVSSWTECWIN